MRIFRVFGSVSKCLLFEIVQCGGNVASATLFEPRNLYMSMCLKGDHDE